MYDLYLVSESRNGECGEEWDFRRFITLYMSFIDSIRNENPAKGKKRDCKMEIAEK